MSTDINPYASPQSNQVIEAQIVEGGGVWRDGQRLVMRKLALLPDRCVKCNAPAHGRRLRRNLSWHNRWIYLLILISILIYVIVALCVRQTAKIDVAICERHLSKRRSGIAAGWLVFLLSVGLFVAAFVPREPNPLLILSAMILFLVSLIYAVAVSRLVVPTLIDQEYVWLKGACPAYLDELPSWLPFR